MQHHECDTDHHHRDSSTCIFPPRPSPHAIAAAQHLSRTVGILVLEGDQGWDAAAASCSQKSNRASLFSILVRPQPCQTPSLLAQRSRPPPGRSDQHPRQATSLNQHPLAHPNWPIRRAATTQRPASTMRVLTTIKDRSLIFPTPASPEIPY